MAITKYQRTIELLQRNMTPELLTALNDSNTVEVILNPDGTLWQEKLGCPTVMIGEFDKVRSLAFMETISSFHNKELTANSPILECELPTDGSRFSGLIPPVVSGPCFTIRKKAVSVFTLQQYVNNGVMNSNQQEYLSNAIKNHKNILIIGGTGSGKTTLVNAVIEEMVRQRPEERPVIIEDTGEIQCSAKNCVQLHTTINVCMTDLLKTTLRMRPDRILVGEVRGAEALDLLMAWNTGHPGGSATLHANDAKAGLDRLETLISMNPNAPQSIKKLISEAVHVVVCIARTNNGRTIKEIIEVNGFNHITNEYEVTLVA
ncbi:MAG: P-type conjugative transfer ATPase TrbB [Succinivibrionaceae bacterium]